MSHTRTALEAALVFVNRDINKPCNHYAGTARKVKELILLALLEMYGDLPEAE